MTVQELIQQLSNMPPNAEIHVDASEEDWPKITVSAQSVQIMNPQEKVGAVVLISYNR